MFCAGRQLGRDSRNGDGFNGALIPSVTVTVKDVDKETTITYVTNSAGFYDTGSIPEDHYLITFTKEGFESYVRGPITLELATVTIDAKLPVGKISQEVVVNTDVAMLSTESGAQEGVLEADSMVQLPQVGGLNGGGADWENFIILLPGASGAPENSSNNLTAAWPLQSMATCPLPACCRMAPRRRCP